MPPDISSFNKHSFWYTLYFLSRVDALKTIIAQIVYFITSGESGFFSDSHFKSINGENKQITNFFKQL